MGWQKVYETVTKLKTLEGKILNLNGSVKEKYKGMEGYEQFSLDYMKGNMNRTFRSLSALLDKETFKELGWQQFQGTVKEFRKIREQILNSDGSVKEEYKGMKGYVQFAKDYYEEICEELLGIVPHF